jgi:hypothetical protein
MGFVTVCKEWTPKSTAIAQMADAFSSLHEQMLRMRERQKKQLWQRKENLHMVKMLLMKEGPSCSSKEVIRGS